MVYEGGHVTVLNHGIFNQITPTLAVCVSVHNFRNCADDTRLSMADHQRISVSLCTSHLLHLPLPASLCRSCHMCMAGRNSRGNGGGRRPSPASGWSRDVTDLEKL